MTGVRTHGRPRRAASTCVVDGERARSTASVVVNCAGQWARAFGALAGVDVPLYAAEHFYVVTEPIAGVTPDLPVMRDPDGYIYYKEEVGGLVMGGFEPVAKPWRVDPIPDALRVPAAAARTGTSSRPLMEQRDPPHALPRDRAGQDAAERPGELHARRQLHPRRGARRSRGYFVCAGFNSAGIANAGGAGKLVAQWIVDGEAPLDLWDVDIRRFAPFHANRRHLADRTVETLGLHYAMRWPREELATRAAAAPLAALRPARREGRGVRQQARLGARELFPAAPARASRRRRSARPAGCRGCSTSSARAARTVVVFDQTSFAKVVLKGRDALAVLQRLCANEIDVPPGRIVYTAMLNARGGFESDLTVLRVAERRVLHRDRLGAGDARLLAGSSATSRPTSTRRSSTSRARGR